MWHDGAARSLICRARNVGLMATVLCRIFCPTVSHYCPLWILWCIMPIQIQSMFSAAKKKQKQNKTKTKKQLNCNIIEEIKRGSQSHIQMLLGLIVKKNFKVTSKQNIEANVLVLLVLLLMKISDSRIYSLPYSLPSCQFMLVCKLRPFEGPFYYVSLLNVFCRQGNVHCRWEWWRLTLDFLTGCHRGISCRRSTSNSSRRRLGCARMNFLC